MATHVVGVDQVGAEDGADDVDLVAEAVGEARAQRAVDEAAGQDGLVAGLALTAEERAGDLAGGVHALFDVDGQREEVGAVTGRLGGGGGDEHDRVAEADRDGAVGLAGQLAGLEGQGLVGASTDGSGDTEWASAMDGLLWGIARPRSWRPGGASSQW